MIILGLDPGLRSTGWGVIRKKGSRLTHLGNGEIKSSSKDPMHRRLLYLDMALHKVIKAYAPDQCAVEEVFVNKNPQSTLKLGQARGVVLLGAARADVAVEEYAARTVKKALVGTGRADKRQIGSMIAILLPGAHLAGEDAADALAVAICHANHLRISAF